ncbi:MAG: hypothetical protein ACT4TC_01715 [Myxococcaceae bacterium]
MRSLLLSVLAFAAVGCAHSPLSGGDLDRVNRPAFISRIEEGGGPKSWVFRDDSSYEKKLGRLDRKEADRRLAVKLSKGMSRFEVAERLRATVVSLLPRERPWTNPVAPVDVARELQSFLVEEVPANPPDYELLKPLGADSVVEFVVEDYGMRSDGGRAGAYISGYGRMFKIDGGQLWFRRFRSDGVEAKVTHVDPFRVAKEPERYREVLGQLIDAIAAQFAKDLTPGDRRGGPSGGSELPAPDDTNKAGQERPAPATPAAPVEDLPSPEEG